MEREFVNDMVVMIDINQVTGGSHPSSNMQSVLLVRNQEMHQRRARQVADHDGERNRKS